MAYKPDKHGRDHCPGGEDPIPCFPTIAFFRGSRFNTAITVAGTSQIVVDWDEWENSDPSVFQPLDVALADADPGDIVRRVELDLELNPGRYTFFFSAHNTTAIAGTVELAMHDGDPIWGREESVLHAANTGLSVGYYVLGFSRIYPLYDPFASGGHTPNISFTIAQNGGASESFSEAHMEIHYERNVVFLPVS